MHDKVARLDLRDLVAHFDDLAETFVTDDQMFAPGRSVAVLSLVNLSVRGIDADLEHLPQHGATITVLNPANDGRMRLVISVGTADFPQMNAVRLGRAGPQWLSSADRLIRNVG